MAEDEDVEEEPVQRNPKLELLASTLPYLINIHGRLLFSEKISKVDATY